MENKRKNKNANHRKTSIEQYQCEQWECFHALLEKQVNCLYKLRFLNDQNNWHISKIRLILDFLWKVEWPDILLWSDLVGNELGLCEIQHTYTTFVHRGVISECLNHQQKETCLCRANCIPAGGYRVCMQINSMFVYFTFQVR